MNIYNENYKSYHLFNKIIKFSTKKLKDIINYENNQLKLLLFLYFYFNEKNA